MSKKENKKRKKFVAWIILACLLVILLVASFVFGNDLLEVINIGKEDNEVQKENSNKDIVKITEDDLKKIYNIIGINDSSDSCGVQSILTQINGEINNLSNKDKYELIYFYAFNNKLLTNITKNEYDECEAYGGECVAITKDNYNKIIKYYNISDKPEQLFDAENVYKDKYIFDLPECGMEKYTHDTKYEMDSSDVVVTDKVAIADEEQTITYIFKLNGNKEYYLYKVK